MLAQAKDSPQPGILGWWVQLCQEFPEAVDLLLRFTQENVPSFSVPGSSATTPTRSTPTAGPVRAATVTSPRLTSPAARGELQKVEVAPARPKPFPTPPHTHTLLPSPFTRTGDTAGTTLVNSIVMVVSVSLWATGHGGATEMRDRSMSLATGEDMEAKHKQLSRSTSKSGATRHVRGHRLEARKWRPRALCDVCGLEMRGGFFSKQGYQCLTCNLKCHSKCRERLYDCTNPEPDVAV
jgi:hypothetical protein